MTALFSGLFLSTGPTIATRAVAKITTSTGDCMLALNPSTSAAFNIQGNVAINVPCGIASASCNNDSFDVTGASASIIAGNLRTCGGINDPHSDVSNSTNQTTGDTSISDPYAGQTMPTLATGYPTGTTYPWNKLQSISTASFDANHTFNGNITTSLTSGTSSLFPNGCVSGCVINGNINLSGATLTLGAGVYFVNSAGSTSSGNISLGANGSLVTSGATVILTSSTASNVGTFNMQSSTSTVTMLAPSSGDSVTSQSNYAGLPGVALYQDRLATESTLKNNGQGNTNTNSFYGGPSSSFTGAAYLPQGCIQWQGTPVTTNCFQLIGDTLSLNGNPGISVSNCGQGEQLFGPMLSALVE